MENLLKKSTCIITFMLAAMLIFVNSNASEINKVSEPVFNTAKGTYILTKGKDFIETITTDEKDCSIYYSVYKLNENENREKNKELYTDGIVLDGSCYLIKAVITKEGFENSEEVKRYYTYSYASPPPPYDAIKVDNLKNGTLKIKGDLEYYSVLPIYIKVSVKSQKGKVNVYNTKVEEYNEELKNARNWSVKLDKPLKSGDKVIVSAYAKDYLVHIDEQKDNHLELMIESIPNSTFNKIKTIVKSIDFVQPITKSISPQMGDLE